MSEEAPKLNFQHPAVLEAIQGRLNTLVGKSSGYIESLPPAVQARIKALKDLQSEHKKLDKQMQNEITEIEKKYAKLAEPLYEKRSKMVSGEVDVEGSEAADAVKGIPEFWLTALKNLSIAADLITEKDEEALKHLTDIKVIHLDNNPGFGIEFYFSENEFFENTVLTKKYFLAEAPEESPFGDVVFDHAEGSEIKWKEGKDLSVTIEIKKQKHKGTGKTRTVKKTVPAETFFSFFKPPRVPGEDEDIDPEDEELEGLDEKLEFDYEVGEQIKEKLVPHAVDWFTGEALAWEEEDDEDYEGYDDEYDEDEEGEEDDEDEDAEGEAPAPAGAAGDKPPECKQQ